MSGKTLSNAISGLQSVMRQVCQSQTTLTEAVERLTRTVDELAESNNKHFNGQAESITELHGATDRTCLITETQSFTNNDNASVDGKDAANSTSSEVTVVTTLSAGKRLTDTYELLEMILLYLPEEALLCTAQRVSKHFRDTIEHSKPLQQKLFFAPLTGAMDLDRPVQINPLLSKVSELPLYYCPASQRLRWRSGPNRHQICVKRPKLETERVLLSVPNNAGQLFTEVPFVVWRLLPSSCAQITTRGGVTVAGSWRRMLLTQPAHECALYLPVSDDHRRETDTNLTIEQMLEPWF
ncbi:hypothetical protein LTS10_005113 [Elasticomyces elasticus]|nr:hypothetical protein LTS10_005113 [Elasticomyces elasticus]